jgi:hypothetical protein
VLEVAFLGMFAKRRRTMEDKDIIQELFLDSSSEDELASHDSYNDQDNTQWTENTQSQHGAPVIYRFRGSQWDTSQ